jgi:hypothetical protein
VHGQTGGRGPGCVPGVGCLERELIGLSAEAGGGELVHAGIGFEGADVLDGEDVVEEGRESGRVEDALEHILRSVREDCAGDPERAQLALAGDERFAFATGWHRPLKAVEIDERPVEVEGADANGHLHSPLRRL